MQEIFNQLNNYFKTCGNIRKVATGQKDITQLNVF